MALRRVLPSRATPEKAPDGAATAASSTKETTTRTTSVTEVTTADATPTPEKAPAQAQSAVAAAATSAFSTLPSAPARVLEESFVKSTGTVVPEAAPAPASAAWEALSKPAPVAEPVTPATPAFSAPAWEAESKAKAEAEAEDSIAKAIREAMPLPAPEPEAPVVKAPWQAPASYASQETSSPALPEVAITPQPVELPAAAQPLPVPLASPPQPEAKAEVKTEARADVEVKPAAPAPITFTEQEPSRPDNSSPHKRRVREKRPRDFSAMGAEPTEQPVRMPATTSFAANVPVDNRPLDKVNDNLIATGVMAPKPLDSLTGGLPTGLAETDFAPLPAPAAPLPEIKPAARPDPAPTPARAREAAPETKREVAPEPVIERTPEPVIIPAPAPARAPEPAPVITSTPAFNLSSTQPAPAADILPPPQSDLPWTRPQAAAEWEIETPDSSNWQPEGGEGAPASTPAAAHMPPPTADLYKPFGPNASAQSPLGGPMSGIPPRSNTHFTPELPGQRTRPGSGTPWLLIAVIVLAAGGAGAYFLRSGGNGKVQQQLAALTSGGPAQSGNALLPPPDNSPFYTPKTTTTALTPPVADTSSSAVVAFADVPADQANQPIVATGNEEVPKDLNVFDRFKTEVQRIKAGEDTNTTGSALAPQPAATATGAITPDKLQEELAAYRSALAQSGDPKSLTPSNFKRDPDGYMDGKPQQAQGTPTATDANGNLLPPPAGNAGVLPPPDLYTNNPKNLPIVNEPLANAPARVRTLADFPDIEPYAPEREKVEIPKNLKPKMAATDFPALEVLSFVPGKGIVAFADGREGVLLIGESLNGWELVNVSPDNAEFKAGQKSYQVTAEN